MTKQELGQYYTTNSDYILQGLSIPEGVEVIEPFVGQGDLLDWSRRHHPTHTITGYDIDPKIDAIQQDTLLHPPDYTDKFVLTNPPYLSRVSDEGRHDKTYDRWGVGDLYKCALVSFIRGNCIGGIIVLPLNFISSSDWKLRKLLLERYSITRLNVYEHAVFDDTDYTVCAFEFHRIWDWSDLTNFGQPIKKIPTYIFQKDDFEAYKS